MAVPLPADSVAYPDEESELDHVGVWYGHYERDGRPRVRTVPIEYVERAASTRHAAIQTRLFARGDATGRDMKAAACR